MRIWITGASGSLGQELVPRLSGNFESAEICFPTSSELDLENFEDVSSFVEDFSPTHVYHLAARVFGVGGHTKSPEASLISNTRIDNSVLGALFKKPPTWIYYASTVATYGYPYKQLPLLEDNLLEGNPHESEYGYSMSKRLALAYLELLKKHHNVKYVYGLSTNLFGRGDRFLSGGGHVIVSLLEKAKQARESQTALHVWGESNSTRDFLSTRSAAAIIAELTNLHTGSINIASGQEISIKSIAEIICESFNLEAGYEFTHQLQGIPIRVCSVKKLQQFSNYVKSVNSLEEITAEIKAVSAESN